MFHDNSSSTRLSDSIRPICSSFFPPTRHQSSLLSGCFFASIGREYSHSRISARQQSSTLSTIEANYLLTPLRTGSRPSSSLFLSHPSTQIAAYKCFDPLFFASFDYSQLSSCVHASPLCSLSHSFSIPPPLMLSFIPFSGHQGVKFDPDGNQHMRLEFARSNTKVTKPKLSNPSILAGFGLGPHQTAGPGTLVGLGPAGAAAGLSGLVAGLPPGLFPQLTGFAINLLPMLGWHFSGTNLCRHPFGVGVAATGRIATHFKLKRSHDLVAIYHRCLRLKRTFAFLAWTAISICLHCVISPPRWARTVAVRVHRHNYYPSGLSFKVVWIVKPQLFYLRRPHFVSVCDPGEPRRRLELRSSLVEIAFWRLVAQ
ncbi:unnamed protein product [Protopolystoma xenopodis]|uniref:Uncharacterized protein n=1 Tax=Protopolystoma xenopodis TaxID=117903 RepID=A0A448WZF7_9PLAT|nr:unnamed protein product [Protopolystoma xenopodis]